MCFLKELSIVIYELIFAEITCVRQITKDILMLFAKSLLYV